MTTYQRRVISFEQAQRYYEAGGLCLAPLLASLVFDHPRELRGVMREEQLVALAQINHEEHAPRPSIFLAADDLAALDCLLAWHDWPAAIWSGVDTALIAPLEVFLGISCDAGEGTRYYIADRPVTARLLVPGAEIRQLIAGDAASLDLSPCRLSPTALLNWMTLGWRVFGAIRARQLLGHALAAYPLLDTEEVASVFTAPALRGQHIAPAVVAATINDIIDRQRQATYAHTKANRASQRVAEQLGMRQLVETWEIRAAAIR